MNLASSHTYIFERSQYTQCTWQWSEGYQQASPTLHGMQWQSVVQPAAYLTTAERVKDSNTGSSSFSPQNSQLTQISGPDWISLTKVFYYCANYPLVNNMGVWKMQVTENKICSGRKSGKKILFCVCFSINYISGRLHLFKKKNTEMVVFLFLKNIWKEGRGKKNM